MATQEIQWTAVPYDYRRENGEQIFSIAFCLTPRLQDVDTNDNRLSEYPDFLDWPATLLGCSFKLKVNNHDVQLIPRDEQPDSDVWKAVFKNTTLVHPFEFKPFTDHKILSFPLADVHKTVSETLVKLVKEYDGETPNIPHAKPSDFNAKTNYQLPKVFTVLDDVLPMDDDELRMRSMKRAWEVLGQAKTRVDMSGKNARKAPREIRRAQVDVPKTPESMLFNIEFGKSKKLAPFYMAELYHTPRNYAVSSVIDGKDVARSKREKVPAPTYDFHQVVSVLREYPLMQRKMGLIRHFDFKVDFDMPPTGTVQAVVEMPFPPRIATQIVTPTTAYQFLKSGSEDTWQFLPRPDLDSEIVGALLCLNNASHFAVQQVDVDAMAMKTLTYTRGLKHRYLKTMGTPDISAKVEAPAVRGTGLQLIRVNRALKLAKMLIRSSNHWNRMILGQSVDLYADDVIRGYRLDVYDETAGTWQSLMRRNATYTFPNAAEPLRSTGISATDEEGVLSIAASRPAGSEETPGMNQLYAHETIAQWEGWSIVVPLIGNHIDPNDELAPSPPKQSPPPGFDYQVESSVTIVPGSLPRLRYGRRYRFRARTADIAGNGPRYDQLNPTDFSCATPLVKYLRWDPIASPTLALRNHPIEGESMECMVIRNYNASEDDSVEVDTTETCERHLFPPLIAQQDAERHGMFDQSPTGPMRGDSSTYSMITGKEGILPKRWYTRNESGNLVPEATDNTEPSDPKKAKNAIAYPLIQQGSTEVPYLPDPMARTVTLYDVPGVPGGSHMEVDISGINLATISSPYGVVTVPFEDMNQWPKFNSIMLRMASGKTKPDWNPAARTLTVFLEKGEQAWIKLSSGLGATQTEGDANLDLHGHKGTLMDSSLPAGKIAAAARGLSWLVSPARTIHLVHATQKPLKKPKINAAEVSFRDFGATNADINIPDTTVHARTTQKIDVFSKWDMWVDNPQKPAPELQHQSAYFYEQHCEDRTKDTLSNKKTQEFGDTKYRLITYEPLATTRFRENMPLALRNVPENLTRLGGGKEVSVLSSKRPDGVKLLYAIPSFRWLEEEKKLDGNIVRSTRKGGGIRIYMERPWYSSGNDELLGVVLYSKEKLTPKKDNGSSYKGFKSLDFKGAGSEIKDKFSAAAAILGNAKLEIPEELQPYVTQWGLDPIWLSAPTPSDNSPRIGNFREPKLVLQSVSLAEVAPSQRFTVVAYEPKFDEARKLWYCDIELDPGASYYPFIRLALARVQPHSLEDPTTGKDVYCSRVSQSTFCQLAPDREAVARIEDDRQSVTVQVIGHTYRTNSAGQTGSTIEVALEKRDVGSASTDLGWTRVLSQRLDRIHAGNLWGGLIKLPTSVDADTYRVVITELEQFLTDPEKASERVANLGAKDVKTLNDEAAGEVTLDIGYRVVYADVLPLK